jgi:hypothetical protein
VASCPTSTICCSPRSLAEAAPRPRPVTRTRPLTTPCFRWWWPFLVDDVSLVLV